MTTAEQKTVNAIGLKQATMEANQVNMADDITEMKQDIKEIKAILTQSSDLYVSKKFVKWLLSITISLTVLWFAFLDHIKR